MKILFLNHAIKVNALHFRNFLLLDFVKIAQSFKEVKMMVKTASAISVRNFRLLNQMENAKTAHLLQDPIKALIELHAKLITA